MGYSGLMGYGMQIPAHQLGGPIVLWVIRGYGFSQVWVKRSSTVVVFFFGEADSAVYILKAYPQYLSLAHRVSTSKSIPFRDTQVH